MTHDAREHLDWAAYGVAARELARAVHRSGFAPEAIVGIARGGFALAGSLGYALDVKPLGGLNVELMTGIGTRLKEPVVLPPMLDAEALAGQRILLADDVSDSGRTLDLVRRMLTSAGAEVRTVCLYTKPGTILEPDWWWRRTDRWIEFPWSSEGPVTADDVTETETS